MAHSYSSVPQFGGPSQINGYPFHRIVNTWKNDSFQSRPRLLISTTANTAANRMPTWDLPRQQAQYNEDAYCRGCDDDTGSELDDSMDDYSCGEEQREEDEYEPTYGDVTRRTPQCRSCNFNPEISGLEIDHIFHVGDEVNCEEGSDCSHNSYYDDHYDGPNGSPYEGRHDEVHDEVHDGEEFYHHARAGGEASGHDDDDWESVHEGEYKDYCPPSQGLSIGENTTSEHKGNLGST